MLVINNAHNEIVRSDLNTSYIFIPFIIADRFSNLLSHDDDPLSVPDELKDSWEIPSEPLYQRTESGNLILGPNGEPVPVVDEAGNIQRIPIKDNRYLFRYIADKKGTSFHYQLSAKALIHWECGHTWWFRPNRLNCDTQPFEFKVQSIHLYGFRTQVGILAFRISFKTSDPMMIANQLYHLKNVEKPQLWVTKNLVTSLTYMSQQIINQTGMHAHPDDFFFFAQAGTARANILSRIEMPLKKSYRKDLYYLRLCYTPSMPYIADKQRDNRELYTKTKNIQWGISPEAAVCLTIPEYGNEEFLHGTFDRSFNTAYLYTYVILLHQKFVLYKFMTEIDSDHIQLNKLEEYQTELSKFENDYVYTRISEVAQYQNFYRKVSQILSLREMYEDVHEPLAELKSIQEANRDRNTGRALGFLSILTVFSALVDSYDFFGEVFDIGENPEHVQHSQIMAILVIAVILLFVIHTIWLSHLRMLWLSRQHKKKQLPQ